MPLKRKPIITKVIEEGRFYKVYFIKQIEIGKQCMIVYPLIEDQKSDIAAAKKVLY